ncbi:vicilin-like seed storage protein At2g18540 [Xenia sp. Carnegie-2017]|uniref:vicilin-like seed storage protein At2g18540 n=1 Tax=Xenia sp. Carnegie-2017 TaxID=2897299 RepID=UPI001F03F2DD|nr:vicilin-like seed storage protein At2g18540 [Xenia sp. Carnegie-2017]
MGMKTSQRSVRERFEKIVKEFKQKESMEERASGIDVEYTERDRAMVDILERMNECEMTPEMKKEKENKEKESAEEMRRKAIEKFGETRRRRNEEKEELASPERKRRRNYDVMELMKTSIETKKKEKEQERELREKELNLMETQLKQQEELIKSMVTQQQQFQQSHQVVTMSILHTLSEITKKLNN